MSLSKRRGFIFQSSEIYGGIGSLYDYGPVGVELKRNVKDQWWKSMVRDREDVVGIDASILMHPNVWVASGHVDSFTDPLAECNKCNRRYRSDLLETNECPDCDAILGDPRHFNLMFRTHIGPVEGDENIVYLRPETAQAMFVDFDNVVNSSRVRIPFGIAQQGKSFRNEITPGNFTYRTREFEQMEMEYFCEPGTDEEWHQYWINFSMDWFAGLGLRRSKLRVRVHEAEELPHYSKGSADVEFLYPWGWGELETISNRTDYDLKAHIEKSGKDLSYYDQPNNKRYVPYVVEPAMGADQVCPSIPHRRIRRRRGQQRQAGCSAVPSRHRAIPSRRPAVEPQRQTNSKGARGLRRRAFALQHPVRRDAKHRQAVPKAGRDRNPAVCDGRFRDGGG